jgi:hypothetical protein
MPNQTKIRPEQALRTIAQAFGGQLSIPLSWVRSRLAPLTEKVALEIEPASPGLRISGAAQALGAPIVFAARIDADGIGIESGARLVRIRLSDVELSTDPEAPGPLAEAIRTGMIDTANPATLVGNMMSLSDMIVEAAGQDVVIDLMKLPAIQNDEMRRAAFAAASSYLCVTDIHISDDAVELQLGLLPGGIKEAALSTARAALTPAVRFLWPEGRKR